jgi:hypothetical protein
LKTQISWLRVFIEGVVMGGVIEGCRERGPLRIKFEVHHSPTQLYMFLYMLRFANLVYS